ncbi:MAG: alpha-L-arabinofuranosidase C-terminal domain-containing protein [Verrucomicrobiota bacterium]|jgi:alpha-L-arabinofuranosidase
MKMVVSLALMAMSLAAPFAALAQTSTVTIQANEPAANISSNLFGIFFEEINMAGDGGIYAEMVRNRLFADSTTSPSFWSFLTSGTAAGQMSLDSSLPLSTTNPECLKLTMSSGTGTVGAANNGYYGIPLASGKTYNLSFYARAVAGFSGNITVSLESSNGILLYAQSTVGGLTTNWQHFALSLTPTLTDPFAQLVLSISLPGSVYLDVVSLFPAQIFNNRTNGLRPDLANMLLNLQPSFIRFPGGSWVGGSSLADAYHWELTVGPLQNRTERANIWGYEVSNGLGFHEYLQMCEDLGTLPLLCINCGMDDSGAQDAVPPGQLGPWVQEALDAIQYANGPTNTYWGAQRAANGHPAPFNLQYIEIGNENSGSAYNTNYALFYDAIKSNYPTINVIADNQGSIPSDAPVDIMDEHFYNSASWFAQNSTLFDGYSRSGPKVFVGEYAVAYAIPPNTYPATLGNALGEAAWMTGLERNSDLVLMASYAPLFCNLNNPDWYPDLIYFNGTNVFGTPSYYVQQMFSLNRGNFVLPTSVSVSGNPLYVSSSLVQSNNQIIVKAVNVNNSAMTTTFNFNGVAAIASSATAIQLSGNPNSTNSFTVPTAIFPVTNSIANAGTNFTVSLPANSLTIFRLQGSGFQSISNLQIQFNSPLNAGQEAVSTVSGQISGQPISLAANYAVIYSSLNTNVAVVNPNGLVTGAGVGTTAIVASYAGMAATQSVQVLAAPPTRLIHRYSFNDGTANDSVGTNNGTFYNGSGAASISGGQLNLVGNSGDYVDFGPGIITTTNITTGAVTFEAWATFNSNNGAWARLFDFGNISGSSGGNYIFLSPNNAANGGNARLAVSDTIPNSDETGLNINNLLGLTGLQIAAVFNPTAGRQFLGLYTNGVFAASVPTGGKYIASINDVYSFLGHSLWSADAWLNGSIDEFRIYDGEVSKFQIAADYQAGANQTNDSAGSVTGLVLQPGTMPLAQSSTSQVAAYLNFTYAGNVSVIGDPNLTLTSDNPNVFTVNSSGLLTATGFGTAHLIGVYDYLNGNSSTFYTNSVVITVSLPTPVSLAHRYSMSQASGSNVPDSTGGSVWNGTLPNGGTLANGQLSFSSARQQYLNLPGGILSNYTAATIEMWIPGISGATTSPPFVYLFAFGNTDGSGAGYDYIFFNPNLSRATISAVDPGYNGEQGGNLASSLGLATNLHLTCVFDCPDGVINVYTNGVLAGAFTGITDPLSTVGNQYAYIGGSLYTSDSYLNWTLQELRIYNGTLNANEVAATDALGPNQTLSAASPTVRVSPAGANVTLSWPLAAAGFTMMTSTNLASGVWTPFTGATQQIVGGQWQLTVPVSGGTEFFRLEE